MPVANKKIEAMAPNSVEKRDVTWKQGQCQMCLTKVPTAKQKTLVNDLDAGTVSVRKAVEGKSHYCGDCAATRKQMKESWLERRDSAPAPKKAKGKKAAKKAAKPAAKKAKKPAAKKAKKVAKKAKGGDPF